ncbi:MAG: hypothetical protein RIT25_2559, partial [Planctomycetota bacterium]
MATPDILVVMCTVPESTATALV